MKKTSFGAWLATFVVCAAFWMLITLSLDPQMLIAGAAVSALVALFAGRFFIHESPFHLLNPKHLFALLGYALLVFPIELLKANLDVAKRALNPALPINPGIVKVPVDVKSDYGRSMLANSITLTPGTITLDAVEEDGQAYYYIHWIDVASQDGAEAGDAIKGTLEKWVGRIWK